MPSALPIPAETRTALVWCSAYDGLFRILSRECPDLHTLFLLGTEEDIPAGNHPFCVIPVSPEEIEMLPERYARHTRLFYEGRVSCFVDAPTRKQHPGLCRKARQDLLDFTRTTLAQTAFRATKGWHLLAGTLLNLPRIFKSPSLESIQNSNTGRPAVIVGAGPALDHDAPRLADLQDQACIIACDAAWNTLIDHGVKPDYVISTDSRDCTWQHLERGSKEQPDVPVITLFSGSWAVVRYYPGPLLFARQDWPLDRLIEHKIKRRFPVLDTGKCVGNAAFELAKFIGSDRIVLIGFNLGFEGNRYHPAQRAVSEFHDNPHAETNLLWVPGNEEDKIRTDYSMFYYLRYFEQQIKACKIPVFNATTGGARIAGCRRTDLQEALASCSGTNKPETDVSSADSAFATTPESFILQLQKWCTGYRTLLHDMLSAPELFTAESGPDPLPDLKQYPELHGMLLSAENPALSSAMQLTWENLTKSNTPKRQAILQNNINGWLQYSAMITQLIDALLKLTPNTPSQSNRWIAFSQQDSRLWQEQLEFLHRHTGKEITACHESPDNIPAIWQAIDQAEGIIMHNSCLMPFSWAFPGIKCIDIIDHAPDADTLIEQWLPGYSVVTTEIFYDAWRRRIPAGIPVSAAKNADNR